MMNNEYERKEKFPLSVVEILHARFLCEMTRRRMFEPGFGSSDTSNSVLESLAPWHA